MNNLKIIKEDLIAWCNWKKRKVEIFSFIFLFCHYPEYRRLLDFRLSFMPLAFIFRSFTSFSTLHLNLYISFLNNGGQVGSGLLFEHGFSTIIYCRSMGDNCCVNQQVTIGSGRGGCPSIGNNVRVFAGAKIIGNVNIGDDVVVGANAVVVKDVPSHCIVAGVPARIIKVRDNEKSNWVAFES